MNEQAYVIMPPPDALVQGHDGQVWAAMFHYAIEGQSSRDIAREHGFELDLHFLENCEGVDDLQKEWEAGANVLERWSMPNPDGWHLAGKWDTEDGPVHAFIREIKAPK